MDNLTHSLIGIALARALPKKFRKPEIYWACLIGNNAPDADFLIHFVPESSSLDYLVHHRGYTHTFLLAPVMGLLTALIVKTFTGRKEWSVSLIFLSIFSCFLHIGADFMNSYGVHPLTPFSNRWFYGDTLFIVEPLIWFVLLPFVAREAERQWAAWTWWILLLPMLTLVWRFPTLSSSVSTGLTGFLIVSVALSFAGRTSAWRAAVSGGLLLITIGAFASAGAQAREHARGYWQSATEGLETWLDTASSPLPGNPFCWNIWIAAKSSEDYRMRSAVVSLWPALVSTKTCDPVVLKTRTADVRRSTFVSNESIRWEDESRISFQEWSDFHEGSGSFRRFISFARFPFIKRLPNGEAIVGDLRYDRESGLGFSEVPIRLDKERTQVSVPWDPPFRAK